MQWESSARVEVWERDEFSIRDFVFKCWTHSFSKYLMLVLFLLTYFIKPNRILQRAIKEGCSKRAWPAAIPIPSQMLLKKHQMVNQAEQWEKELERLHITCYIKNPITVIFCGWVNFHIYIGKLHVRTHLHSRKQQKPSLPLPDHWLRAHAPLTSAHCR